MILNLNEQHFLENPTEERIRRALKSLSADDYAILSREKEDYVQCYFNEDKTYQLEYRAGSFKKHFVAVSPNLKFEDILVAFVNFIYSPNTWFESWEWAKLEFDKDFDGGEL